MDKIRLLFLTAGIFICCLLTAPLGAEAGTNYVANNGSFATVLRELQEQGQLTDLDQAKYTGVSYEDTSADFAAAIAADDYKAYGFTDWDLELMACVIYAEANSMGYEGKAAVGNVVLNRMNNTEDWSHVSTIEEVIYDRHWGGWQFSTAKPNSKGVSPMDRAEAIYESMDPDTYKAWQIRAMEECTEVAKDVLCGYKAVPDYFLFFNGYIKKTTATCLKNGYDFVILDQHIYYTTYTF